MPKKKKVKPFIPQNPVADHFFTDQILGDIMGWALVNYLSSKGVIDFDEFYEYLHTYCQEHLKTIEETWSG